MSAKRLAIICPSCGGTGAVANVALHHARELAKYHPVALFSDTFPAYSLPDVQFVPLKPRIFSWLRRFAHVPNEIAFALAARAAVERLHREYGVDFILSHGHPVARICCVPLQRRLGIPYGLVTHGDIFDRPKGTYDPRLTWFYQKMTPGAYRHADLVVALSPYMQDLAIRGGAQPERIQLIPNGIDPTEIGLTGDKNRKIRKDIDRLELLYVGRLSIEKGVDILVEAAVLLREQGVPFRLRIAGEGVEGQRLRDTVSAYEMQDSIEFLGSVPRLQLGALYQSADIVCVPSRSDPLPTVVLEAMIAGVPVLGANVGGIPHMIDNGISGFLFEAECMASFIDGACKCWNGITVLTDMGKIARLSACESFSWKRNCKRLYKAIFDLK